MEPKRGGSGGLKTSRTAPYIATVQLVCHGKPVLSMPLSLRPALRLTVSLGPPPRGILALQKDL
jgi:hypothetical protein